MSKTNREIILGAIAGFIVTFIITFLNQVFITATIFHNAILMIKVTMIDNLILAIVMATTGAILGIMVIFTKSFVNPVKTKLIIFELIFLTSVYFLFSIIFFIIINWEFAFSGLNAILALNQLFIQPIAFGLLFIILRNMGGKNKKDD